MNEVILITGFPNLGPRKMVSRVLSQEPDAQVVLLVLDKLVPEAAQLLDALPRDDRRRIEVLVGDVGAIDLGLSGREYRDLAAKVTRVHHMAHVSYVGVEREVAYDGNVRGAVEMVELGLVADRLRCIVHHSTAHVSGNRKGRVYEEELEQGQDFHSVVQETRFEAERVLRRAMDRVPIAVVRPTMVVADSVTGEIERMDGANLLVLLVLGFPETVPLPALGSGSLDVVPLDFVVDAAYAIGRDPRSPGRTHHLTSDEDLSARQVFELIARAGGRSLSARRTLPTQVMGALMRTPGVRRLIHEPRALLQQLSTPAQYDTRNARSVLDAADIRCPELSSYVDTWVKAVSTHLERRRDAEA